MEISFIAQCCLILFADCHCRTRSHERRRANHLPFGPQAYFESFGGEDHDKRTNHNPRVIVATMFAQQGDLSHHLFLHFNTRPLLAKVMGPRPCKCVVLPMGCRTATASLTQAELRTANSISNVKHQVRTNVELACVATTWRISLAWLRTPMGTDVINSVHKERRLTSLVPQLDSKHF